MENTKPNIKPRNIPAVVRKRKIQELDRRIHHCYDRLEWYRNRIDSLERELWNLRQEEEGP